MRVTLFVEDHRGDNYYIDIPPEMIDKESNIVFHAGALVGLAMKHGGKVMNYEPGID